MTDHRVERLTEWLDDLDREITQLQIERSAIRQALDVLDRTNGKPAALKPDVVKALDRGAATAAPKPAVTKKSPKKRADNRGAHEPLRRTGKMPPVEEIAKVYNEARAAGQPTTEALMSHFGAPRSAAKNWPSRARAAGLLDHAVIQLAPPAHTEPVKKIKGPTQLGGRRPSVDYTEVAKRIVELREAGQTVDAGIASIYSVPVSTAKNWIARCRAEGLVPKLVAGLRVVEDNTSAPSSTATFDPDLVAKVYLEAVRVGGRCLGAVADEFDISREQAKEWIARTRAAGKLPAAGQPQLPDDERREILNAYKPEALA